MRIALLSDIHGNREAFAAVLDDALQRGTDRFAVLGDIVGYGPDPGWCIDRVRGLVADGALCVKGNHDHAVEDAREGMNTVARAALDWSRERLAADQRAFLAALPLTETLGDILLVHASANDPGDFIYVTGERKAMPGFRVSGARLIFCGHVHVPALYSCDLRGDVRGHAHPLAMPIPLIRSRRWMAVIGSVGQPRDGNPGAGYALLDTARNELTFCRVPYAVAITVEKLRAAGLPDALATRLSQGV